MSSTTAIPILAGVGELADAYDGFIVDVWGVLHDGVTPYPGAIDALNQGSMRLAELMMDTAVSTALKGKTMDQADMGEGPDAPHPVAKAEFE